MSKQKGALASQSPPEGEVFTGSSALNTRKIGKVYTYVGGGEDSPRVIDFMGKVRFVRGKPTEVTDDAVLKKLAENPVFIEGEVEEEELHEYDLEAKKKADAQRDQDRKTQSAAIRSSTKHNWADAE